MPSNSNQSLSGAAAAGRLLSFLVIVALLADAGACLFAPDLLAKDLEAIGFATDLAPALGAILAASTLIYAIPKTTIVGAILITGFLGGAICAHFRLGEFGSQPQVFSVVLGVGVWASIYLRMNAFASLLPLRELPR